MMRVSISLVAAVAVVLIICTIDVTSAGSNKETSTKESWEEILHEYDLKKVKLYREQFCRNQDRVIHNLAYRRICNDMNKNYLKFFFILFAIIAVGSLVRTLLKTFELNVPYTVILMIIGLGLGFISWDEDACVIWSMYTRIGRTPPKIILEVFLPVLIFESAFSMKAHVFYRSAPSIMVLAFPGMVICTFFTAFVCSQFFYSYQWNFMVASLYGSIISATDPVAVVAILKEIGTSELLSIMIEGESLLNDASAILFYTVFLDIVIPDKKTPTGGMIFWRFCRIAMGGPLFGWFVGKLSVAFLSRIFNDAAVEVSVTLAAAYLTYIVGESYLEVSGVMAVMTLGIVLSAERTCISPEVQGLVHHFWEMLGHLANTVLFVIVGIAIAETAINSANLEDLYYMIFLYFALNISRLLMIVVLSPILSHVGYGLSWQNLLVMTWSGLRGAVGLCLSLEVFGDKELCDKTLIGPKSYIIQSIQFLLQTAGIVMLTLIINGTTTKALLDALKLTELSVGKIQDMANAVRQVKAAQTRRMGGILHDRFLADSNPEITEQFTKIENPYAKHKVKVKKSKKTLDLKVTPPLLIGLTDDREKMDETSPVLSMDEYRELTEECRLRLLKAMKVSCWRQYEQGVLTEEAVHILVDYLDRCEDQEFKSFETVDLKRYWEVHGCVAWVRNKLLPFTIGQIQDDEVYPAPPGSCAKCAYCIVTNDWFDGIVHIMILLNIIPIIWETVLIATDHHFTHDEIVGFLVTNAVFTLVLMIEFILKIIGFGLIGYCSSKWNMMDAFILAICIIESSLSLSYFASAKDESDYSNKAADTGFLKFLRFFRIVRVVRVLRLFKPLIPRFMDYLNWKVNMVLFYGYDVAKGSATAIDDVMKFLPQMIDNQRVHDRFRIVMEEQRLELLLEMGLLQKDHPGIAIAIKTRHANRAILNQLRGSLQELKEDGLVDQKEYDVLLLEIESKMKNLWHTPNYIEPRTPDTVVLDIQWVAGDEDLQAFLLEKATLLQFAVGDVLFSTGDEPNGIYIILSGVVKVYYEGSYDLIYYRENYGFIPDAETFQDPTFESEMTDFFTTGAVLGELNTLMGCVHASTATCETGVELYHVSQSAMIDAMDGFKDKYDTLEGRLWRTFGMKVAASVLPSNPFFQAWTLDKIKMHMENSAVPMEEKYLSLTIPPFISDAVLIFGQVRDASSPNDLYTAPCLLPSQVTKVMPTDDYILKPRILLIAKSDMEQEAEAEESEEAKPSPNDVEIKNYLKWAIQPPERKKGRKNRPNPTVNFGVQKSRSGKSQSQDGDEGDGEQDTEVPGKGRNSNERKNQ